MNAEDIKKRILIEFEEELCEKIKGYLYLRNWNKHNENLIPTANEIESFLSKSLDQAMEEASLAVINMKEVNEMAVAEDAQKEGVPKEKILEIITYWQGFNRAIGQGKKKRRLFLGED